MTATEHRVQVTVDAALDEAMQRDSFEHGLLTFYENVASHRIEEEDVGVASAPPGFWRGVLSTLGIVSAFVVGGLALALLTGCGPYEVTDADAQAFSMCSDPCGGNVNRAYHSADYQFDLGRVSCECSGGLIIDLGADVPR
jgi:hypothetical protein